MCVPSIAPTTFGRLAISRNPCMTLRSSALLVGILMYCLHIELRHCVTSLVMFDTLPYDILCTSALTCWKLPCCIESKGNHYLQRNWECMGPHGGTLQIILKHLTQIQYQWTWKHIFTYNVSIISVVQWVVTVPEHSASSNILSPSSQENINGFVYNVRCPNYIIK